MVASRSPAVVFGAICVAFAIFKQTSLLTLSHNQFSQHESLEYQPPKSSIESGGEGTDLEYTSRGNRTLSAANYHSELMSQEKPDIRHQDSETESSAKEPEDEPILQGNPDDDQVEISLDETDREAETPYAALKMIEEAVAKETKLAKEKAYNKYGVPPQKPGLDDFVPFSQFSHIHYVGVSGLGHRLLRHLSLIHI